MLAPVARAVGTRDVIILLRHILPNVMVPITVQTSLSMGMAILFAAGLGFLGIGVQPPTPEWGAMIADGQSFIRTNWWLATVPGLVIVGLGLGLSLIGEGLEEGLRA